MLLSFSEIFQKQKASFQLSTITALQLTICRYKEVEIYIYLSQQRHPSTLILVPKLKLRLGTMI